MQSTHTQFAIKQAAAMALVASAAFGASTIEVTAYNSPYALTAGVTLAGGPYGVWPASTVLPSSYSIAAKVGETTCLDGLGVDFSKASLDLDLAGFDGADKEASFILLEADSIAGYPPASLLDSLNATAKNGKWKFVTVNRKNLVLRYAKFGFAISFR